MGTIVVIVLNLLAEELVLEVAFGGAWETFQEVGKAGLDEAT